MKRILFLLWLASAPLMLAGQSYETPAVEVSTEKANIGGKVYYLHKVLAKQTVFSICKAYGVTSEELAAANPDLKDGLKAGSIIFIPADAAKAADSTAVKPAAPVQQATAGNDDKEDEKLDGGEDVNPITRVVEHRVRWYESIKTIARKYDVSVNDIIEYNGLDSQQLSSGMILLVPIRGGEVPEDDGEDDIVEENNPDPDPEGSEESPEDPMTPVRKFHWFSADDPIDIALILPINASGTPSASFLNFYSGALLAVQEQKEQGAHIVLNVYDLSQGAEAITADRKFSESDIIIGPVEASTMAPFLEFSDQNGIPFVSPLDHKADSLAAVHSFFFQVPASTMVQARNLAGSLHFHPHDRVILVHSNTTGEEQFLRQIENAMMDAGISYRKVTAAEIPGQMNFSRIDSPVKVIIGSENKVFASEVIRSLNVIAKKNVPMEVYFTNRVRNYETSDPDALFNIAAHVPAPYFVDYSNPKDQEFVLRYRALFSAEPDDFAFQGYDIFTYFISAMTKLGTAFSENADSFPMQLLHCNFLFQRDDEKSGWRNNATRDIVYNKEDFSITISK